MTDTDPADRARRIAYHDSICYPHCGDDISTYPTPPDEWTHNGDPTPYAQCARLIRSTTEGTNR